MEMNCFVENRDETDFSKKNGAQKKIGWLSRLNNKINTPIGYIHIGMLGGAITAIIFNESLLVGFGIMTLWGLFWGIAGYLKFK